jgi:hypothetical protein
MDTTMGFDDDVDAARKRLEAALAADGAPAFDATLCLRELAPKIRAAIQSRRLGFELIEDEEEPTIEIVHLPSEEALGFILVDESEYIFESNLDEYFEDFVDADADSFVLRLYETLRADLAKYEVEVKG